MKVKICGIRGASDAEAVAGAGADRGGFVLVPSSARAVSLGAAAEARRALGAVAAVGVFRDASEGEILRAVDALDLAWVQLHGAEPLSLLARLAARCSVLRAVAIGEVDRAEVEAMAEWAAAFLIDGPVPGAGVEVDHSGVARRRFLGRPFFIAGGLGPHNVQAHIQRARPDGVDVASGVARDGAIDATLAASFVARARAAPGGSRR